MGRRGIRGKDTSLPRCCRKAENKVATIDLIAAGMPDPRVLRDLGVAGSRSSLELIRFSTFSV